jgi:DNA-binding XRE family transcriptional regulator
MTFLERLHRSAIYAGVSFTQSDVAEAIGIKRQTVHKWFNGTIPETPMVAIIAVSWRVDPIWLATGQGTMIPAPGSSLTEDERELLRCYRNATPTRRKALYDIAKTLVKTLVVVTMTIPAFTPVRSEAKDGLFNITMTEYTLRIIRVLGRWMSYISAALHNRIIIVPTT